MWDKDPFILEILNGFCFTSESIIQKIDNSLVFSEWLARAIQEHSVLAGAVRNLRAAKHRFESEAKPIGRFCIHIKAIFVTAHRMAVSRCMGQRDTAKDNSGLVARDFLQNVSAEGLLLTAMVADAFDEGLLFTRFFDDERVDLGVIATKIKEYFDRLDFLFVDAGVLASPGYTSVMMEILASGQLQAIAAGKPKQLVAPDRSTVDRCLERMRGWVALSKAIAETEFPNHDLFIAFGALNIDDGGAALRRSLLRNREPVQPVSGFQQPSVSIRRLAAAFKVDDVQLASELQLAKPVASRLLAELPGFKDNRVAWAQYMKHVKSTSAQRTHPTDALGPVLARCHSCPQVEPECVGCPQNLT